MHLPRFRRRRIANPITEAIGAMERRFKIFLRAFHPVRGPDWNEAEGGDTDAREKGKNAGKARRNKVEKELQRQPMRLVLPGTRK